ncbi:Glycosyl transferases group 1 [Amphibacillus marinus]|uniref:Glycosyl transferases group 1 n=1 Tax=Amphibacillus marinus TaxID=872970 RepID=A0A1H8N7D8_9BACI|nr:glycosyltransferase family 4 protein [Amphibacillus marinus]SEO25353.1 Glycosyl transferases group 1 [Amphibacillus marinus]
MKILFVAPRFHTNQVPIVQILKDKGNEVCFYVQYIGGSEDHSILEPNLIKNNLISRLIIKTVSKKNNEKSMNDPFKLVRVFGIPPLIEYYKKIKEEAPDLVIVRDRTPFSLLTFIICKLLKTKSILYQQIPKYFKEDKSKETIGRKIKKIIYKVVVPKKIITPIQGEKSEQSTTDKNIYFNPFIMKVSKEIERRRYFNNSKINVLVIGKFVSRKRHILIIKAIECLRENFDIKLTIVGEVTTEIHKQELERVSAYISSNNLTNTVQVKINLPYGEVQKEYLKHDLFVLPSINEQFGVSILEAMAHGLAVICSNSAGAKDYIIDGHNGFIFKEDDLSDLRNKITNIIKSRDNLKQMGFYSLQLVRSRHSPEIYYENFIRITQDMGIEQSGCD